MRLRNRKSGLAFLCAVMIVTAGIGCSKWSGADVVTQADASSEAVEETVDEVVFSQKSGVYDKAFELELSSEDTAAEIFYTTDGSNPSDESNTARVSASDETITVQSREGDPNVLAAIDPILFDSVNVRANENGDGFESTIEPPKDKDVDKCTVIKAAARHADGTYSPVYTNTYFIGNMAQHIKGIEESCRASGMDLSVMSISMEKDDLFDSAKGIYVKGDIFDQALSDLLADGGEVWGADDCRSLDANYKQKGREWERNTHIDYFESNGTDTECKLQQDCGIRIQGNYSRSDYQKGFRLYARKDYGTSNFHYAFWDNEKDDAGNTISKYKKITLRNGGNCAFTTKFSDAYWQSLMDDVHVDTNSSRPCVVYINGEYWGVYVLQTDYCDNYMQNKHGVNKDDVIIYKGDAEANHILGYKLDEGELPQGVTDDSYYFQEMEDFLSTHTDVADDSDYEEFAKIVDVDSALDYYALQVWINNKWDWPGKNWSMWKTKNVDPSVPYADGKWRFLVYDVEFGGISGKDDVKENAVKNSKLLSIGSRESGAVNYDKPNVRCFAMLMTNRSFRDAFRARLEEFSDSIFEKQRALDRCTLFEGTYQPILDQFFRRFPTKWPGTDDDMTADMAINGHGWGTYATSANIRAFLKSRATNIPAISRYIKNQFKDEDPTPTPEVTEPPVVLPEATEIPKGEGQLTVAATEAPAVQPTSQPETGSGKTEGGQEEETGKKNISPLKITAKKGSKTIRVVTMKKTRVTVTLSSALLKSGGKQKKTVTIAAGKNKTGTIRFPLSSGLKKGMRVTVQVSRKGYRSKTKTVKI